MESPVDSASYENLLWNYIKSKLLKFLKSMKVRSWSKLRPERLGVIVWILPSETVFFFTFEVLKLRPWTPTRALKRTPGPHPCWASRGAALGAGCARTLEQICPYNIFEVCLRAPPSPQTPYNVQSLGQREGQKKMKIWILFLQCSKCIPINLKRTPKTFSEKF